MLQYNNNIQDLNQRNTTTAVNYQVCSKIILAFLTMTSALSLSSSFFIIRSVTMHGQQFCLAGRMYKFYLEPTSRQYGMWSK